MTVAEQAPPNRRTAVARLLRRAWRPSTGDLDALRIWLVSRCAVLALTWPAEYLFNATTSGRNWLSLWQNWDAVRLAAIAQFGYFGPPGHVTKYQVASLPGFPLVLDAVHAIARQWTVSGLVISFVAGGVAAVLLGRIAEDSYGAGTGSRAVLFLVASPAAIFLAAGYSEALFLALALGSWLAVRKERWFLAVPLAGLASVVRVNGLFLCAALAVEILRRAGTARLRALATFVPALVPLGCYELYLRARTSDWLAWFHAERQGWQRQFTSPIDTFKTSWTAAFGHEFSASVSFVFQLEIVAVLAGVLTTIALLGFRRWSEAIYTGLTIGAMATSFWYESVPRALLLLWPVWCGLAAISARRSWIGYLYLALAIPVSVAIGLLYLTGNWAG
jgi:Gpi18-like mannosyltransferase